MAITGRPDQIVRVAIPFPHEMRIEEATRAAANAAIARAIEKGVFTKDKWKATNVLGHPRGGQIVLVER